MARARLRRASSTWSRASWSSMRCSRARSTRASRGSGSVVTVSMRETAGRLDGIAGGKGQEGAELLQRRFERGLGAHQRVLGLRGLKLGSEDVELAGEADLEAGLRGLEQALASLQALPRHGEELALGDHAVEGARGLNGQALASELVVALLGLLSPAAVGEVVVGGVRARASQQGLPHEQGGRGAPGGRVAAVLVGRERRHPLDRAPAPGKLLGEIHPEGRAVGGLGKAWRHLRQELAARHSHAKARGGHAVGLIEDLEVALEGEGHGRGQAQGAGSGRGAGDRLVLRLVGDRPRGSRAPGLRRWEEAAPGPRRDRRRTIPRGPWPGFRHDCVPPVGRD